MYADERRPISFQGGNIVGRKEMTARGQLCGDWESHGLGVTTTTKPTHYLKFIVLDEIPSSIAGFQHVLCAANKIKIAAS